jgi:hypothetical protein
VVVDIASCIFSVILAAQLAYRPRYVYRVAKERKAKLCGQLAQGSKTLHSFLVSGQTWKPISNIAVSLQCILMIYNLRYQVTQMT